mmetsp:Transcript_3440/g.11374  ORF Transcript_3440/g.11374 Transcript_3440/m.11374 type:complete len:311 (+) Transcript_3440:80-1012(+)
MDPLMGTERASPRAPMMRVVVAALVGFCLGVCALVVPLRRSSGAALSSAVLGGTGTVLSSKVLNGTELYARSDFSWVEARGSSWDSAADGVIARLKAAGVKRGQIVNIDAHNNGPDGDAIFSAHYSLSLRSLGDLNIEYSRENTASQGWADFYDHACAEASKDITDHISITSSINEAGRGVTYVFKYAASAAFPVEHHVSWRESRAGSWNAAADSIIHKIKASGAQRGQVLGIDAHNNGPTAAAIFSATLDLSAPGLGPLEIGYYAQNTGSYGWSTFYNLASQRATADVICITSCNNENGRGVTYLFYYK